MRLTLFLVISFFSNSAMAGAWLQEPGKTYYSESVSLYGNQSYFDMDGERIAQPAFLKLENQKYIEYGAHDKLTIGANLALQYLYQENEVSINQTNGDRLISTVYSDNIGLGNSELFLRTRLWHNDAWVVSLQPMLALPAYYYKERLPQGGTKDANAELSLLLGHNFELAGRQHYADLRFGYRKRYDNVLNDQWKADAKAGFTISDEWQVITALYSTFSTDMPEQAVFTQSGQNDYDLLKMECQAVYYLRPQVGLAVGGFADMVGKNTGAGYGVLTSVFVHY